MNLIDDIKVRLNKYPAARYESDGSSITVFPHSPDGFAVTLVVNHGNVYTISFEGWHEGFEGEEEALNVFALGLSDECRLKEYRRGSFAYKWWNPWTTKDSGKRKARLVSCSFGSGRS
jgi:hypothetical protein